MAKPLDGRFEGRTFASGEELQVWLTLSTGGSVTRIGDWEVDAESLAAGILGMLQAGLPVWLGTTRDGGAVTVTTEIAGDKHRVFVRDAIEWDEYWVARAKQADLARTMRNRVREEGFAASPAPPGVVSMADASQSRTERRRGRQQAKQAGD